MNNYVGTGSVEERSSGKKKREKALPFGTLLVGGCHDASFAKGPVQIY